MLDKPTGEWNYLKILRKSERVSGGKRQSTERLWLKLYFNKSFTTVYEKVVFVGRW